MNLNFSMYSGFSSLVKKHGIEYAAKTAKEFGFSSVEFFDVAGAANRVPTFEGVEDAKIAKAVLDKYSLSVACYSVGATLVTLDSNVCVTDSVVTELKRYGEIAAALGCPYLHHTLILNLSLKDGAPSLDEVLLPTVNAACEVADHCKKLGITCIYEDQGMYFNGVFGFGRFFDEMKKRCDNVGVCGDIGNVLFVDEEPLPFFEAFIHDIKHVHLKDYKRVTRECKLKSRGGIFLEGAPPGTGDIDVKSCLKTLYDHGYCGAFAIEDEFINELPATFSYVDKHFC